MSAYDVSQKNARVALVAVRSGVMGSAPIASFDSIDSYQDMLHYINLTHSYTDFEHDGQAVTEALTIAIMREFIQSGYRTGLKNHVIVYVTATTKFEDDPHGIVDIILGTRSYGIIAVGYGPLVTDPYALQLISGGRDCSFVATDLHELQNKVEPVQRLINNANENGGKYCGMRPRNSRGRK
ncbi:hypothetical protein TELCIR_10766 [Teladorsagia circumcincta]|uniref:VWFA domain-containing protein n=1 Tax=Teladorsagia circumcincta TaxID=45464 RepID=A0A2G9UCM2_TELCI|nr:hypothetical protein TELCIR_10766 [Teladorsagia circumcincta]